MERFWAKIDQSGGEDSCWIWTAARAELRARWAEGETQKALAGEFGISQASASRLVNRQSYRNMEAIPV